MSRCKQEMAGMARVGIFLYRRKEEGKRRGMKARGDGRMYPLIFGGDLHGSSTNTSPEL
jgi:hypothetical protein